jgi:cytoskeletal protein CcmA (bactofilin family)
MNAAKLSPGGNNTAALICAVFSLVVATAFAGDLTVDGLTVQQDAIFQGSVSMVQTQSTVSLPTNGLVLYYSFSTNGGANPSFADFGQNAESVDKELRNS